MTPDPTQLRSDLAALVGVAETNLDRFWSEWVGNLTPDETRAALLDVLPALVETYGDAAGTIAADWYDDQRERAAVAKAFTAVPAEVGETGSDVLARWGIAPLFGQIAEWETARVLLSGGMQRRITNAARDTVRRSAIADPSAQGWMRSGAGGCDFCKMLIGRGAVYSQSTADFASHDHCRCVAVPKWGGSAVTVRDYVQSQAPNAVRLRAARARAAEQRARARATRAQTAR